MPHIAKYKRPAVAPMVAHNRRLREPGHYGNERIDPERTPNNYRIGGVDDVTEAIARAARNTPKGKLASNAVVMFSVGITLPRDWPEERPTREFFELCHTYNQELFPTALSLGMEVHLDETTPHAHDMFSPTTADGRFNYGEVVPRRIYQRYHKGLQDYLREHTGLTLTVLLPDEEKGAKALSKLNQQEYIAAKREEERMEAKKAQLEADVRGLEDVQAVLEPAAERIQDSARYLAEHRGDGARASEGATHLGAARDRVRDLEAEKERLGDEVRRLERHADVLEQDVRRARGRISSLREHLGVVGERVRAVVTAVVSSARERYYRVPQAVAEALRALGVPWDRVTEMSRATWDAQERKLTGLPTVQHTLGIER